MPSIASGKNSEKKMQTFLPSGLSLRRLYVIARGQFVSVENSRILFPARGGGGGGHGLLKGGGHLSYTTTH